MQTVSIDLMSPRSVDAAVSKINAYIRKLQRLAEELPKALAGFGVTRAEIRYSNAVGNIFLSGSWETPFIDVHAEPIDGGWAVVANGEQVCFVEFGAGVYYNGDDSYLGERPEGIVGIGEYGEGKGKRPFWVYVDDDGEKHYTQGTPANNTLFFTAQEMRSVIEEAARKILNND